MSAGFAENDTPSGATPAAGTGEDPAAGVTDPPFANLGISALLALMASIAAAPHFRTALACTTYSYGCTSARMRSLEPGPVGPPGARPRPFRCLLLWLEPVVPSG